MDILYKGVPDKALLVRGTKSDNVPPYLYTDGRGSVEDLR